MDGGEGDVVGVRNTINLGVSTKSHGDNMIHNNETCKISLSLLYVGFGIVVTPMICLLASKTLIKGRYSKKTGISFTPTKSFLLSRITMNFQANLYFCILSSGLYFFNCSRSQLSYGRPSSRRICSAMGPHQSEP